MIFWRILFTITYNYLDNYTSGRKELCYIQGSFIKFPGRGCNLFNNQVPFQLCNNLYIYISDLLWKFHSFILYSFYANIFIYIHSITEHFEMADTPNAYSSIKNKNRSRGLWGPLRGHDVFS